MVGPGSEMIAAIYARKSTDQTGVAADQRSVTRQVEHATAYALRKGWTVAPAQVYVDDGISSAELATRPGFVRLMTALKPAPAFGVLIMSEEFRLGREAIETAYALKQVVTAGVDSLPPPNRGGVLTRRKGAKRARAATESHSGVSGS
ncbi:MAG: recombinase family protein [Planctomycetes bacterium]|nr:recombinase family protein [Planctomycetota bacterium]